MEWVQEFKVFLLQFLERFVSKLNEAASRISRVRMSMFLPFARRRRQKVGLVALVVLATFASSLFLFNSILGQLVFRTTLSSHGAVKTFGVGVYWDSGCSFPVYSLDWGLVDPGSSSDITFHIRNEGNYPVTLFLGAENWNPESASDYLTLNWDYVGQTIDPSETVQVTLSLLASPDMGNLVDFYFDVILGGNA